MNDLYDPSKIRIPKTNADFWLALLRVRDHHIAEACDAYVEQIRQTGGLDDNHVWKAWLLLDLWLDQAFDEWRIAK